MRLTNENNILARELTCSPLLSEEEINYLKTLIDLKLIKGDYRELHSSDILQNIFRLLGVSSIAEAVRKALYLGIIEDNLDTEYREEIFRIARRKWLKKNKLERELLKSACECPPELAIFYYCLTSDLNENRMDSLQEKIAMLKANCEVQNFLQKIKILLIILLINFLCVI